MADVFVEKVIEDGPRYFVKSFSYTHVDAGQSAVMAIDVSGLSTLQDGTACTGVRINKIWFSTSNLELNILWDASTDVLALVLPTDYQGSFDFSSFISLCIPRSSSSDRYSNCFLLYFAILFSIL